MDINNMDDCENDETVGSADDAGFTRTVTEGHDVGQTNDTNDANTEENSVGIPDKESYHKPLKRDPVTGKFIAGTGSRAYLGGRPKGAKDRVSRQMLDIAQSLLERRGSELLEEVADRAPSEALALITKIIPASELTTLFNEERAQESGGRDNTVRISVVSAPERLSDNRTAQQLEDQQRGLTKRLSDSQEDRQLTVGDSPTEPVSPSGDRMDAGSQEPCEEELRLLAELERVRKQNEVIKAHGGLTGRAKRSAPSTALDYPDEDTI